MIEVTDKMVEAARKSLAELSAARGGLRAAIEAALAVREPPVDGIEKLVEALKPYLRRAHAVLIRMGVKP